VAASAAFYAYANVAYPRHTYLVIYWCGDLLSSAAGFAVTWEIYRQVLAPYPGVKRMCRWAVGLLFLAVVARALVAVAMAWPNPKPAPLLEMMTNLRLVQCGLLLALVLLKWLYSVPLGRNLWAMLAGYGAFIAMNAVTLAARVAWGREFHRWLQVLQPLEYCLTLLVWCIGLWRYVPNPKPGPDMECDYERVSEQTAAALHRVRNHLTQSLRT
jgi:hypothetical protein